MGRIALIEEPLSHSTIGAVYEVYNTLGFGILEHVYVMALERELMKRHDIFASFRSIRMTFRLLA